MTWRELIYAITDITKQISDDSQFNEDHIIFLCAKYRNYILNSQYLSHKKTVNDANYQILNVGLEEVELDICPNERILKSKVKIPFTMPIGQKAIYPTNRLPFRSKVSFVPFNRFPYIGNKYSHNTIYASIGPDNYLYVKSENENFVYLTSITIKSLWEDIAKISLLDAESCGCDLMDTRFPLEDAWVGSLMNLVINDLIKGIYNLRDNTNDAFDSSDTLAQAIQRYTNTQFKALVRGNQNKDQAQ